MLKNPFVYTDSNKRYHTFDYYLKNKYGCKVFKVSLNAGFSCPNRDGKISIGGCIYCSKYGAGEFSGDITNSLLKQFEIGTNNMKKKWKDGKPMAYFQAFSNTYASIDYLHQCYDQFVNLEECIGICIATRPDCLNDEIIEYLSYINSKKDLYIELGLQTSNDNTAKFINRGYSFDVFKETVYKLNKHNIKVVVHIINGLPNESYIDMINTIKDITYLPIFGLKFHCLNILKDTRLADIYKSINLHILTKDEYLNIVKDQLEYLNPNIVIERINTDSKKDELIEPTWNIKKVSVSNDLDKLLESSNSYQGLKYKPMDDYILYSLNLLTSTKNTNVLNFNTNNDSRELIYLKSNYDNIINLDQINDYINYDAYLNLINIDEIKINNIINTLNCRIICIVDKNINFNIKNILITEFDKYKVIEIYK